MFGLLVAAAGLAAGTSPDPAALAVPPGDVARATDLVRRLAADDYRERDRATRELRAMGRLALPALATAAATADDPEARGRCASLLPRAEAADTAARVAAFLADDAGRFDHGLPGWARFRAAAGADEPARRLFAELLRAPENRALLAAADRPVADVAAAVVARRRDLQARFNPPVPAPGFRPTMPDLSDVAALLFAESLVPEKLVPFDGFQYHVSNFLYQPAGQEAVAGTGPHAAAFRRLTLHWMDTRSGPAGAMAALNLSRSLGLAPTESARFAAKLLDLPDAQPWYKSQALGVIAKSDARNTYLPAVVRAFADDTPLVRGGPAQPDVQVRDFALAMAAVMTGQNPTDYGLEIVNSTEPSKYNAMTYRFRDDDAGGPTAAAKRAAAFAKWKSRPVAAPKSPPPAPGPTP